MYFSVPFAILIEPILDIMSRVLVAFLVIFNSAVVIYLFYFYHIVNEVQQELKIEKEDTHRSEKLQFRPLGKGNITYVIMPENLDMQLKIHFLLSDLRYREIC